MTDLQERLQDAFETEAYDVGEVSVNRKQIRVVLHGKPTETDRLREIVDDVVGTDDVLGLDVTTESVEGEDAIQTVVSFRTRS